MRSIFIIIFTISYIISFAQNPTTETIKIDSLLIVKKNPNKGFYNDYILFIPKGTPLNKKLFLLVEPNNTGKISDSIEVHKKYAVDLASVSSVGNNISTELKIPLLVPIFPRPESQPLIYTHALDRDVMEEKSPELKRLDLQLLEMINDAKSILASMNIPVDPKVFMNGFSASATFTNRFSFIHPEKIEALAIGGFNGLLMLPQNEINGIKLNYPIGINDFPELFDKNFDTDAYRSLPQFIYMGKLDENDAVQFDDAYNENERKIINENIGRYVQERYLECQKIYQENNITPIFKSYENIGHWTTSDVNLEVIKYFHGQLQESSSRAQNSQLSDQYIKLAEDFKKNLQPDSSIVYYEKASIEFQALGNIEMLISSYNQIGIILTRQDEYEKARIYLEKALSIGLSSLDSNNLEIATTYISLGVIYNAEGNYKQSLIYHYKALSIRLHVLGKTDPQVATSYGNIGNVYFNAKDYDKSIDAHLKAMKIREKVFGKTSVEIIESYRGLGNAYREKKKYKKALEYFTKALDNKIIQRGQGHKDLVRFYNYISEVYYLMDDNSNGEKFKIKAEEIDRQSK